MSQNEKLLRMMERGRKVTRLTALHAGVMNLTARIADLRNAGHNVVCTMDSDEDGNEYGVFTIEGDWV